jgi:carbonic anhydrase
MCQLCVDKSKSNLKPMQPARRALLKLAGSSPLWMAGLGASSMMVSARADDAHPMPKPENVITSDQAIERLMKGNARYVSGNINTNDSYKSAAIGLKHGQNPYAVILSCADSRVSPELCFDEGPGDLFVNRIAGNYVTTDLLGSIEYGTLVLKSPLVMVLGHTECGAIKAAMKAEQENTDFPGHIQSIASHIGAAVRSAKQQGGKVTTTDVVKANIKLNVAYLQQSTPIIRKLVQDNKLKIVGGMYNLEDGTVSLVN